MLKNNDNKNENKITKYSGKFSKIFQINFINTLYN